MEELEKQIEELKSERADLLATKQNLHRANAELLNFIEKMHVESYLALKNTGAHND